MKARSVRQYLRPLKSSTFRSKILAEARNRMNGWKLTPENREALAAAVFVVENELESRGNGRPRDPSVVAMREIRNAIYDDIGGINEPRTVSKPTA